MSILYTWIAIGIIFIIIEMITTTFYGLSLAIAAFVTALYVFFVPAAMIDIRQTTLFLIVTTILVLTLPKYISNLIPKTRQGMEAYIGKEGKIKKQGDDFKIVLDGISYNAKGKNIEEGKMMKVIDFADNVFHVTQI